MIYLPLYLKIITRIRWVEYSKDFAGVTKNTGHFWEGLLRTDYLNKEDNTRYDWLIGIVKER